MVRFAQARQRDDTHRISVMSAGGALNYLRSIPQSRRDALFNNIIRMRGRMQYPMCLGTPGGHAFDAIAVGLARHHNERTRQRAHAESTGHTCH